MTVSADGHGCRRDYDADPLTVGEVQHIQVAVGGTVILLTPRVYPH